MRIEETEDGDLPFGDKLSKGVVIFPETEEELLIVNKILENINKFSDFLKNKNIEK